MARDLYTEFNKLVWEKWFLASQGSSYFIAKYDDHDHFEVLQDLNVTDEKVIASVKEFGGYYWSGFREEIDGIPASIGIIGLQILNASRMTQREFREGFCLLMNMSLNQLQEAFDYSQHEIWTSFSNAITSLGFHSNIQKRQGPWCFVNYPLYQSYLNEQDIESIVPYIRSRDLNLSHKLRLDDFILMYRLREVYRISSYITNRFSRKLKDERFSNEIIYRQVYKKYLLLEPELSLDKKCSSQNSSRLFYSRYDGFSLYINEVYKQLSAASIRQQLLKIGYKINRLVILRYDDAMMEYCEVHRFDCSDKLLVITMNQLSIYQELSKIYSFERFHGVFLFFIERANDVKDVLADYLSKKVSSITITGGLKIHRKAYLSGYGPVVKSNRSTSVFINEIHYSLESGDTLDFTGEVPALYEIKVPDEPTVSFYIEELKNNVTVIEKVGGLSLSSLRPNGTDIYGQEILIDYATYEAPTPRAFINNTLYKGKVSETPSNLVLRNLKRQII